MRLGSSYLTSNRYTAFPFEENATGLASTDVGTYTPAALPIGALVDAVFVVPDTVTSLYLSAIVKAGTTCTFLFVDQDTSNVGDGTLSSATIISEDAYGIMGVEGAITGSDQATVSSYGRILYSKDLIDYLDAMPEGTYLFASGLPFESVTAEHRPQKVWSLESVDAAAVSAVRGATALDGHVKLLAGYNIEIEEGETDDADTTTLEISAIAGAGAGTVPCDDIADLPPRVPQQLHPDATGNVRIVGDACYAVYPRPAAGEIQLLGSCYACCDCADFVATGNELRGLLDRTAELYLALRKIHVGPLEGSPNLWSYEDAVTQWNTNASRKGGNYLEITGYGLKGYLGAFMYGTLALFIRNHYMIKYTEVEVSVTYDATCPRGAGWRVQQGNTVSIAWPPTGTITLPAHTATTYMWELFNPAGLPASAEITVRYKVEGDLTWYEAAPYPLVVPVV